MPRSRINGNFIDKTFSIVANILLRIIPTTSGEKRAFTYYRDGLGRMVGITNNHQVCTLDTPITIKDR
ncbi:Photosystem I assembly protein Ycf3 [Stylosanthes scabra]|uniref:Photosystem I assembly protein Ycf3 n=1 Tax=Stylosanthes scabra TaxID=79078 RepID=A0ABU6RBE7_9FABA|nr:Photosystem I assembly protein Ycf3 [Stylosanthes scabra]